MSRVAACAPKSKLLKNIGRILSSAVFAYAAAYRNAAFAGPAARADMGRMDPATYSAPADVACAQGAQRADGGCIAVKIDHLRRLPLDRPVGALLIGNPAIADATLISDQEAVITAKSVGATNMIFLDADGAVIVDLEILVLESGDRRVMLRRGPSETASYQCAPRCERTLSQTDSAAAHAELSGKITSDTSMSSGAAEAASQSEAGGIEASTVPGH